MTKAKWGKVIKGSAIAVDVSVPFIATISQFPLWIEQSSEATMSGLFLLFALLSSLPFLKQIKAYFKSPSVWVVWTVLFVTFTLLRNIIDQMIVVAFAGLIANIVGTLMYKAGAVVEQKEDKPKEETEDVTNG